MPTTTILVVDNDESKLQSICTFLEKEGYHVIPAISKQEGKRLLEREDIDLAVIDIRLFNDRDEGDLSGIELARETPAHIPKVIYSTFATYDNARLALGTRVDGLPAAVDFVAKYEKLDALLTAIRKAEMVAQAWREQQRAAMSNQTRLGNATIWLDVSACQLMVRDQVIELTRNELSLLEYFFQRPNQVIPHEDIVREVLQEEYNEVIDKNRVNNMIHRLRKKFEVDSGDPEFLRTVHSHGFKLVL